MTNLEAYIFLFNDTFLTSLLVVPRSSYIGDVMLDLNIYNPYLILIVSLIAGIFGSTVNWIIGSIFRNIEKNKKYSIKQENFINYEKFFLNKGKWILLLSCIPFWGPLFTTCAGVLRYNFFHFLILVSFSKFVAFSIHIFL